MINYCKPSFFIYITMLCANVIWAQQISLPGGITCNDLSAICVESTGIYRFENNTNPQSAGEIACLSSTPAPSWFYFRVSDSGDLIFQINQWVDTNNDGINDSNEPGLDVDFVAWGPFSSREGNCNDITIDCPTCPNNNDGFNPNTTNNPTIPWLDYYINDLDNSNIIDCSWSARSSETLTIHGAQSEEYYILLITNYSSFVNQISGLIEIQQTNLGQSSAGAISCFTLEVDDILGPDVDVCDTGNPSTTLDANPNNNPNFVDFSWEYDDGTGFVPIPGSNGMDVLSVSSSGSYRVTITSNLADSDTDVINVFHSTAPVANSIPPQIICDTDNQMDGFWNFDLASLEATVLNGQSESEFNVTFHSSSNDAASGTNTLPLTYTNTAAFQQETVYVRIENSANTACYDTGSFTIEVFPQPPATTLTYEICDNFNATDGYAQVDLSAMNPDFLGSLDPSQYTVSYHASFANADANIQPLPNAYTNSIATTEIIYVRVENNANATCYSISESILQVIPGADAVKLTDLWICENETDYRLDFDLTQKDEEILNGRDPILFDVAYFATQEDANNSTDPISGPYTNLGNPEQIFVAITNTITGCSNTNTSFNIGVYEAAKANEDGDLIVYEVCDDFETNDGFYLFDLTLLNEEIYDGQNPDEYSITYHYSVDDALDNINPLPTLYENSVAYAQTIYARVSFTLQPNECYAVSEVPLRVNDLFSTIDLDEYYYLCAPGNDSEQPLVVDTGLSGANYSFEWSYEGTFLPDEIGPSIIPTQEGEYSVMVYDKGPSTVCFGWFSTTIVENYLSTLDLVWSAEAFSGNHTVEAKTNGTGDYEYSLDNGPWQEDSIFTDVGMGIHEVQARDKNGCGIISNVILVFEYPLFFTPNGDGNNDTWHILGLDTQLNPYVSIHDKYGTLLKVLKPNDLGWEGTYDGNDMPSSDYWFKLIYDHPSSGKKKQFQGHFSLKR